MKLDYLAVGQFKNLRDFKADFDENPNELFTVVLGRNGLGKSNLLEVLVVIFRDLFLGAETDFAYELRYTLQRGKVKISVANSPKAESVKAEFSFTVKKADATTETLIRDQVKSDLGKNWLPRHVFAYYSGPSDRLEEHFRPHQKAFYKDLLKGKESLFRPLFYARPVHSNFVLMAFFTKEDDTIRTFLKDRLRIEGLESVLFVLRKPKWKGLLKGDSRFWKAAGTVQQFLSKVWDMSLAPMRLKGSIPDGFDRPKNTEFVYLHLRDLKCLQALAEQTATPADFFKELESTYMSDLIHETRIRVKVRQCDGSLTFRELSEGEQQLLTVVGLLRFTKEEESLFLLDEPDTHLNPAWGMEYLSILQQIAETGSDSQIIIATHDPLMIAPLRKQQVLVLDRVDESGTIVASHPEIDPQGMGVSGILKSSMFGLRTTLDQPTQAKLDRRFELTAKDNRKPEEEDELIKISAELADSGFAQDFRDDNYYRYARALAKVRFSNRVTLSRNEIDEIEAEALAVVKELGATANQIVAPIPRQVEFPAQEELLAVTPHAIPRVVSKERIVRKELSALDALVRQFGNKRDTWSAKLTGNALLGKALIFQQNQSFSEALNALDDLTHRVQDRRESSLVEILGRGLLTKAWLLANLNRTEEALFTCDYFLERHQREDETPLITLVIWSSFIKSAVLTKLGRPEDAILNCDNILNRLVKRDDKSLVRPLNWLLLQKSFVLRNLNQSSVADDVVRDVLRRTQFYHDHAFERMLRFNFFTEEAVTTKQRQTENLLAFWYSMLESVYQEQGEGFGEPSFLNPAQEE